VWHGAWQGSGGESQALWGLRGVLVEEVEMGWHCGYYRKIILYICIVFKYGGITMVNSSLVQVRVEPETKKRVENLFRSLGLDTASAVRLFFVQSLEHNGIPFFIRKNSVKKENFSAKGKYKGLYSTEKFLKQKLADKELE
jgi:addiction module RelB/DinJ family antitoxin